MRKGMALALVASLAISTPVFGQDGSLESGETASPYGDETGTESGGADVSNDGADVSDGGADSGAYPISLADRPMTLAARALNADASFHFEAPLGTRYEVLTLGATYGIIDNLEARAGLPITFGMMGTGGALDLTLGATYRFLEGEMEMGAALDIRLPITTWFEMSAGVPIHFHIGGTMRIRTGAALTLISLGNATAVGLNLPAAIDVSWLESLPITLRTGFHIVNFDGFGWTIPLGLEAGWSFGDGTPFLDLLGVFDLPTFLTADGVTAGNWELGVRARIYIL